MAKKSCKESNHCKWLFIRIVGRAFILIGIGLLTARLEFSSDTVLAQNVSSASKSEKVAEEFDTQRRRAASGQWLFYRENPILVRGELDSWDDFKVGSPVVIKESGRYRMWYRGCHFIGDEYTCGIGHAVSHDGILWEKSPRPVLVIEDADRSKLLHTVAVLRVGDGYMMWYSLSSDWFAGRPYATIYLATSTDGLDWRHEGAVLRAIREGTTISHSALYDGKIFHLWYVDSPSVNKPEALMHVTSSDGRKWQITGWTFINTLGVNPGRLWILSDKHSSFRGFFAHPPDKQRDKGSFGTVVSADRITWERRSDGMDSPGSALTEGFRADTPAVILEPGGLWVWFVMRTENGAEAIGVAYRKGDLP